MVSAFVRRYVLFSTLALVSMFAGSQVVHSIYKPLDDLPEYVEREKAKLRASIELLDDSKNR